MTEDCTASTELYLIRHGETAWNVEKRMQGHGGVGLNARGRQQAMRTAHRLNGQHFDALYTSDLDRARETAQIIGEELRLAPQVDERLRERDQGEWSGMRLVDVSREYGELFDQVNASPANVAPPGGEDFYQVAERIEEALNEIARRHPGQRVVIVSHGLAIGVARSIGAGEPLDRALSLRPRNAEIVRLCWPDVEP